MPELPEVETVRRGLERLVVGRTISSVEVKVPKMIKTSYDSFLNDLPGQTIQAMRRRGKYLIFDFGQLIMISHLRMEGKYLLFTDQVPANKHFHLFFTLDDMNIRRRRWIVKDEGRYVSRNWKLVAEDINCVFWRSRKCALRVRFAPCRGHYCYDVNP